MIAASLRRFWDDTFPIPVLPSDDKSVMGYPEKSNRKIDQI
jgi:hypothetical protein